MQEVAQLSSELLKKAEAGEVDSQFQIGFRYAHGTGVPKNLGTAAHWYRKAAERGDMRAQYFLGVLPSRTWPCHRPEHHLQDPSGL
jgi:TPR repeat protein